MKHQRTVYVIAIAAVICVSFSAGFLFGRRTAGGTYTISTELALKGKNVQYDILTGEAINDVKYTEVSESAIGESAKDKDTSDSVNLDIDLYLNINTCTLDQLILLPNIGETRASSIIEYREKNGPFRSIADIMQVSGIGESTFDKIKQFIYVDIHDTAGK